MGLMIAVCAVCGLTVFTGAFLVGMDRSAGSWPGPGAGAREVLGFAAEFFRIFGTYITAWVVVVLLVLLLA